MAPSDTDFYLLLTFKARRIEEERRLEKQKKEDEKKRQEEEKRLMAKPIVTQKIAQGRIIYIFSGTQNISLIFKKISTDTVS